MDKSTTDPFPTSRPTTSEASPSATSSPVSAAGPPPFDSVAFGRIIDRFGRAAVLASLSPSRAKTAGLLTSGTSGPPGPGLSASAALQSSLESRLRPLLNGSDLCEVTWKPWATPWGQSLSRPRARVRTTSAIASGLWRTMTAEDCADRAFARNSRGEPKLSAMVKQTWPTPVAVDAIRGSQPFTSERGSTLVATALSSGSQATTEKRGALNPEFVCWLMGYPSEWLSCAPSEMPSTSGRRGRSSKPSTKA